MYQIFAQVINFFRKTAAHLIERRLPGIVCFRVDKICNGFSLSKIKSSLEKRPFGKFTWLGQSRSRLQQGFDDVLDDKRGAMTGNFYGIFLSE